MFKDFSEKETGAHTDRPELRKFVAALGPDTTGVVFALDRLARSTRDLLNLLATISEQGASFKSLNEAWADTTTAHGRLMLTVISGIADFERHLIARRTADGRSLAMKNGVRFGRKPKLTPHQRQEALARRQAGETITRIARTYAVSHSTISRLR